MTARASRVVQGCLCFCIGLLPAVVAAGGSTCNVAGTMRFSSFANKHYDVQAPGTYYLLRSGGLDVQIITVPVRPGGPSIVRTVAIRDASCIVTIEADSAMAKVTPSCPRMQIAATPDGQQTVVRQSSGAQVRVSVREAGQKFLNLDIDLPGTDKTGGLCGARIAGTGMALPGGKLSSDVGQFALAWSVPQNDSAFRCGIGCSGEGRPQP